MNAKADWLSVSTGFLSFDYIAMQEITVPATVFESLALPVCIKGESFYVQFVNARPVGRKVARDSPLMQQR